MRKASIVVYFGIIATAAALVLIPGSPLGLLTEAVQTLAGVLLPSATVFLLLLCNDKAVLGPWVNSKKLNLFTGAVVWVLVMLVLVDPDCFGDVPGHRGQIDSRGACRRHIARRRWLCHNSWDSQASRRDGG